MRIAVIGAGAMGALYGGYLSRKHDVLLVDVNRTQVDAINARGLTIHEPDGGVTLCRPRALLNTQGMAPADVVILFVKAMLFSKIKAVYMFRIKQLPRADGKKTLICLNAF